RSTSPSRLEVPERRSFMPSGPVRTRYDPAQPHAWVIAAIALRSRPMAERCQLCGARWDGEATTCRECGAPRRNTIPPELSAPTPVPWPPSGATPVAFAPPPSDAAPVAVAPPPSEAVPAQPAPPLVAPPLVPPSIAAPSPVPHGV